MKIYHGSKYIIKKPLFRGSNPQNDYGAAFYTTQDLDSAEEWAGKYETVGVVNEYKINTRNLKILDLTDKTEFNVLTWLAILMHFRDLPPTFKETFETYLKWLDEKYYINVNDYDVIIGYRADDAYFSFPLEFIRGNLTLDKLETIYLLGNLGKQVVIISQKAIDRLEFVQAFESNPTYVGKYKKRVDNASNEFKEILKNNLGQKGIKIGDLYDKDH